MMDFIMVPTIMAIITLGIYKLFEVFVCKKERLMLIEKMGDTLNVSVWSCFTNNGIVSRITINEASLYFLPTGDS